MRRWRDIPCLLLSCLSILALLFSVVPLSANEDVIDGETVEEGDTPEDPLHYGPEGSYYFGYRWVSHEDSFKAAEYQYPHSSVIFGIDGLAALLPHRYHLNAEFLNKKDFYGDFGYAYSDLVLFRDVFVGVRHNLDHFNYQYPGVPPIIRYNDRNAGDRYSVDYFNNALSLRLKTPDFPFHVFFANRYVEREGTVEERFMLGDYSGMEKISTGREIE